MSRTIPVLDPWTPLSYKTYVGANEVPTRTLGPVWVGEDHQRRLAAYMVLQALIDNASRFFSPDADDTRREYGDAALFRNTTLSALLGDDYRWITEGAEDPIQAVKLMEQALRGETPKQPKVDPTTALPIPGTETAVEIPPEELAAAEKARNAQAFQAWFTGWCDKQKFNMKMFEVERNSVGLGDGVYALGFSPRTGKIRLRTYDPMFYFPELSDEDDDEYPDCVHFAWEIAKDRPDENTRIRRVTYRLVPLERPKAREYGQDETYTCLMSDGTWTVRDAVPTVHDLTPEDAQWATYIDPRTGEELEFRDVDLQIGFIPVIHVPNTIAGNNHYGTSSLAHTSQIFEDLAINDTDQQASSATTGKPPVVLKGGTLGGAKPSYKAGQVWEVDENGGLDMLDTSNSLAVLNQHNRGLLSRLSTNARIPDVALGKVKLDQQIAGIAIRLVYGPMDSMIREMRMVREDKYRLLPLFVWRMARQYGVEGTPSEFFPTSLSLGNFIPADQNTVVTNVVQLIERDAISLETGVLMLMKAGVPISDVAEEVIRIQHRDFKGANLLLNATGDQAGVFGYLGRPMPEFVTPPTDRQRVQPGDATVTNPSGQNTASGRGVQANRSAPGGGGGGGAPGAGQQGGGKGGTWVDGYFQERG